MSAIINSLHELDDVGSTGIDRGTWDARTAGGVDDDIFPNAAESGLAIGHHGIHQVPGCDEEVGTICSSRPIVAMINLGCVLLQLTGSDVPTQFEGDGLAQAHFRTEHETRDRTTDIVVDDLGLCSGISMNTEGGA